jgi:uncharacterized protein (TIGR02001 family)
MFTAAGVSQAGLTGTVTATSDYDFRGYTQTSGDPALQASIDYAADNGFYVGAWGSNVDFGDCCDENLEVDLYAGWAGGAEDGLGYSFNAIYYTYPGANDIDFPEINAGITYKMFSGKLWYSWDFGNSDEDAWYLDGNLNFSLPQDYGLTVHAGYSGGDYWKDTAIWGENNEYFDWAVGVTKSFGHFAFALKYIDGSDALDLDDFDPGNTPGVDHDILSSDGKIVLSVATTFPWTNE